eukprot:m.61360 g.61360  ORF g.61360 m.61360 type:complete len:465 (-) comp12341_c0_seq3:66-1460(-)
MKNTLDSTAVRVLGCAAAVLSSPWWLPPAIVKARFWIFTSINGEEGRQFPDHVVRDATFKWLYNHDAAKIRSRQGRVGITDLFWYMLAPAHYIHQEHLESDNPQYHTAAAATKKILNALPKERLAQLAREHAGALAKTAPIWHIVRLRDFFFPLFIRLFHEIIFEEHCPDDVTALLAASGSNVIAALKFTVPRDMTLRGRALAYLEARIAAGHAAKWFEPGMSVREQALHLLGVFYHTACVQLSEAMAHLIICIAQHPDVDDALQNDPDGSVMELVIKEQMRLFPLFGVAHRMLDADVTLPDGSVLHRGAVLLFNYQAYQTSGFENPLVFNPWRWKQLSTNNTNYIPFGVPRNRPCPGQQLSLLWMKEIAQVMLASRAFVTPIEHTRSLPCGGLCVSFTRPETGHAPPLPLPLACISMYLRLLEAAQSVTRSVFQLVLGTINVIAARRAALAVRYFSGEDLDAE